MMHTLLRSMLALTLSAGTVLVGCSAPPAQVRAPHPASLYTIKAVTGAHSISVSSASDSVSIDGYTDTGRATVQVLRPDAAEMPLDPDRLVVIGTASGSVGATGHLEINTESGVCWETGAPDILAGDVIRVIRDDGGYDETRVAHVSCGRPLMEGSDLVIHGNATDGFGNPLPLDQLEHRLNLPTGTFALSGRSDLRAAAAGGAGSMAYTQAPVNPGDFTVVYRGLSGQDLARALDADSEILWLGTRPEAHNEKTSFADPAVEGAMPGCLAGVENGITYTDHPVITPGNAGTDVILGGVAEPAVAEVAVSINEGTPVRIALPRTEGPKAWSLKVPAAWIGSPAAGPYRAVATFRVPAGAAQEPHAVGDLTFSSPAFVMPLEGSQPVVQAVPAGGSYLSAREVELTAEPHDSRIYYTLDGSEPTQASRMYTGTPIPIRENTALKYFAVRPDGSATPVQTELYIISVPVFATANPRGGTYHISQYVYLTSTHAGAIHYTLDGSDPTPASTRYDGQPILISATATLKFTALDGAGQPSAVMREVYTINDATAPEVSARPFAAPPEVVAVASHQSIRLSASERSRIYYTTDGTEPTTDSRLYGEAIQLRPGQTTLKFMAVDLAGNRSETVTALYQASNQ